MKLFSLLLFLFAFSSLFSQQLIIKNDDGTYEYKTLTNNVILYFNAPCKDTPTIEYGGQIYNTIQVGTQCWLKENLNIGTSIDGSLNQTDNSTIEKYCYNNLASNCTNYGGLYQWAEAVAYTNGATNTTAPNPAFSGNIQGICPSGWHIPSRTELTTLQTYVAVDNSNALKAVGEGTGDGVGTNTSGFSALLKGGRNYTSPYFSTSSPTFTAFWCTEVGLGNESLLHAYRMSLGTTSIYISINSFYKTSGYSVRCLRD